MTTSTTARRRLDDARNKESHLYAQREAAIERLAKLDVKLKQARRLIARLDRSLRAKVAVELAAIQAPPPLPADPVELPSSMANVNDDIPKFLDRRNLMADPKTKEHNAERRAIEKEKRDAKLTGKLKQMPLTGRAALDAIRKS